jgi:copper chaperone CopZ
MQTSTFDAPALFGDHHVTEVRRVLFNQPGVQDVYASSAFRVIQVTFDAALITHDQIRRALDEAGYLGDLPLSMESGIAVERKDGDNSFRHTSVYEQLPKTVSFTQHVPYSDRPLWNCPGLGVVRKMDEE